MDEKWVVIFSTTDAFDAEIKLGLLSSNEIEAVLVNKKDSFYFLGEVEIHVRIDDIIKAKHLINSTAGA